MPYVTPKDLEEFEKLLKDAGSNLVVIDFFATWCGPCKTIAPVFKELSDANPDMYFVKIDVDQNEDVAAKYNVSCMPTFVFVKSAAKVFEFSGANEKMLRDKVTELK